MNTRFLKEEERKRERQEGAREWLPSPPLPLLYFPKRERERELLIAAGERAGEHGAFFKS